MFQHFWYKTTTFMQIAQSLKWWYWDYITVIAIIQKRVFPEYYSQFIKPKPYKFCQAFLVDLRPSVLIKRLNDSNSWHLAGKNSVHPISWSSLIIFMLLYVTLYRWGIIVILSCGVHISGDTIPLLWHWVRLRSVYFISICV